MAQGLVVVADTSAWIAAYRPVNSAAKDYMLDAIQNHTVLVPDLVLVEILRGIGPERKAKEIETEFNNYQIVEVVGRGLALRAAFYYRTLRSKGITVRGTVDLMIATWCIENDVPLLHADRDFAGFEEHLGLKRWPPVA
jgi:predicted nucleic acid-binding protein